MSNFSRGIDTSTIQIATSFRSKQPQLSPNNFNVVSDVPPKLIEMYDMMECGSFDYGYLNGVIPMGNLDPRDGQFEQRGFLIEELEQVQFDWDKLDKTFKIGK